MLTGFPAFFLHEDDMLTGNSLPVHGVLPQEIVAPSDHPPARKRLQDNRNEGESIDNKGR